MNLRYLLGFILVFTCASTSANELATNSNAIGYSAISHYMCEKNSLTNEYCNCFAEVNSENTPQNFQKELSEIKNKESYSRLALKYILRNIGSVYSRCGPPRLRGDNLPEVDISPNNNDKFLRGMKNICNLSISIRNEKYCSCFSKVMLENTPDKEKVAVLESGIESIFRNLLTSWKEILVVCEDFALLEIAIPEVEVSAIASKILKENAGKILTPSNYDDIHPLKESVGWMFNLVNKGEKDLLKGVFILTGVENGEYFFNYGNVVSGQHFSLAKYKWINGFVYHLRNNVTPNRYIINSKEKCKFTLGKCSYLNSKKENVYMYTEFRDGMWIRNAPGGVVSRRLEIDIYDSSGFPLYFYYKNLKLGYSNEEYRVTWKAKEPRPNAH